MGECVGQRVFMDTDHRIPPPTALARLHQHAKLHILLMMGYDDFDCKNKNRSAGGRCILEGRNHIRWRIKVTEILQVMIHSSYHTHINKGQLKVQKQKEWFYRLFLSVSQSK